MGLAGAAWGAARRRGGQAQSDRVSVPLSGFVASGSLVLLGWKGQVNHGETA